MASHSSGLRIDPSGTFYLFLGFKKGACITLRYSTGWDSRRNEFQSKCSNQWHFPLEGSSLIFPGLRGQTLSKGYLSCISLPSTTDTSAPRWTCQIWGCSAEPAIVYSVLLKSCLPLVKTVFKLSCFLCLLVYHDYILGSAGVTTLTSMVQLLTMCTFH